MKEKMRQIGKKVVLSFTNSIKKFKKFFIDNIVAEIIATVIISIAVWGWHRNSLRVENELIKEKAFQQIVFILNNSVNEEDLRKTAAISLGMLNRIDIVKNELKRNEGFIEIIEEFDTTGNFQYESDADLIFQLLSSKSDEQLKEIDKKARLRTELANASNELRRQREWFSSEKVSKREKKIVEENKVIEKIAVVPNFWTVV